MLNALQVQGIKSKVSHRKPVFMYIMYTLQGLGMVSIFFYIHINLKLPRTRYTVRTQNFQVNCLEYLITLMEPVSFQVNCLQTLIFKCKLPAGSLVKICKNKYRTMRDILNDV